MRSPFLENADSTAQTSLTWASSHSSLSFPFFLLLLLIIYILKSFCEYPVFINDGLYLKTDVTLSFLSISQLND